MKIKTSNLTDVALDWAVATCKGLPIRHDPMNFGPAFAEGGFWIWDERGPIGKRDYRLIGRQYSPSNNWAQGGPIIELNKISPRLEKEGLYLAPYFNGVAHVGHQAGPTPLVAAMRCYVASKLGDTVDVPEELVK